MSVVAVGVLVVSAALVLVPRLVRAQVRGRSLGLRLGDATVGVPHDYGDGLRRINLDGVLTAHLLRASLEAEGVDVRVNTGGGGMLGALDAPAHIVYATGDEAAVLAVLADLDAADEG